MMFCRPLYLEGLLNAFKTFCVAVERLLVNKQARKEGRKEGNVLFNDALKTFNLQLYGAEYTDSERGNPLSPHRLLFPISRKSFFFIKCPIP